MVAYDNEGSNNGLLDVAFRENVFYTARFWKDNDDTYVSAGSFNHIRCDLGNGVMGALNGASSSAKVEQVFDTRYLRVLWVRGFRRFYPGFPHESYVP